ncbi:integrase core domain-containing protein [Bradyrhizobium ottawaense]|uniref:integrase core domain-containing protein n=1 Tax=Bradyrhizobium ottawaense TaxID=931866 RepID=UPI003D319581
MHQTANWVADYNHRRSHSSLKYLIPAAYTPLPRCNPTSFAMVRCPTRATWPTPARL